MAKKIEMLNDLNEVVHPLTSSDCVIMENGKTLEVVMGDGIATPTVTHEGASFQVGVGDSNIEVVDGDVAGMTLEGQTYQNILPKPTTLIMETDEQEFKINDKIDNNIVLDDNIAEIATVKGQTYVNVVQEESATEYTVLGEDLSGQSITTTGKPEGVIKNATLEGMTLVNTIQEPSEANSVVLDLDADINAQSATIDNTVQGGIKSAILKGQTLVNLVSSYTFHGDSLLYESRFYDKPIQSGETLTVFVVNPNISTIKVGLHNSSTGIWAREQVFDVSIIKKVVFTVPSGYISKYVGVVVDNPRDSTGFENGLVVAQGDQSHLEVNTYFEGMQSVKMPVLTTTGKNLLEYIEWEIDKRLLTNGVVGESIGNNVSNYINVSNLDVITFSGFSKSSHCLYDKDKNIIGERALTSKMTVDVSGADYIRVTIDNTKDYSNPQMEVGSVATSYEPFKSNILTTPEDLELRGIGDVKDTLDCLTGELTERIGEIVLDGSEDWGQYNNVEGFETYGYFTYFKGTYKGILCDRFKESSNKNIQPNYPSVKDEEALCIEGDYVKIRIKNISTIADLKLYLSQNPITIQYHLETESIKTVDLTIKDQDNNSLKTIQAQPTLTHITTSSNGLIPFVTIPSQLKYPTIIKPSTTYTLKLKRDVVDSANQLTVNVGGVSTSVTSNVMTITTPSTLTSQDIIFTGKNNVISKLQLIEGDVTGIDYPFFEGMLDVKSPKLLARGKNLIKYRETLSSNGLTFTNNNNQNVTINGTLTASYWDYYNAVYDSKHKDINPDILDLLQKLPVSSTITLSNNLGKTSYFSYRINGGSTQYASGNLTIQENMKIIGIFTRFTQGDTFNNQLFTVQLEIGSTATSYEPYKGVTIEQDIDSIQLTSDMFEQQNLDGNNIIKGMSYQQVPRLANNTRMSTKTVVKVKPNTTYTLQSGNIQMWCMTFDKNGGYIKNTDLGNTITTDANTYYLGLKLQYRDNSAITPSDLDSLNLTLQEVPQEIVLRSLRNGVKDTLNLTTGEYVQRIGEVVFDGSDDENWFIHEEEQDNYINKRFRTDYLRGKILYFDGGTICNIICDKVQCYPNLTWKDDREGIEHDSFYVSFRKNCETVTKFKQCLSQDPITIQYQLITPIITKVNLTNTTKLPSYNSITHYDTILPSNSLIPNIKLPSTIDYNVAIKPSTQYTIRANTTSAMSVNLGGSTGTLANGKVTLTTPSTLAHNSLKLGNGKAKEVMVIEGSEIKDNVPFFNGMKNVQMGGIKLVNLIRNISTYNEFITISADKRTITYTDTGYYGNVNFDSSLLKPNTLYTLYFKITQNTSTINMPCGIDIDGNAISPIVGNGGTGTFKVAFTSLDKLTREPRFVFRHTTTGSVIKIQDLMLFEGDWTHLDEIPFIESEMIIEQPIIKSQGKNLVLPFNNWEQNSINGLTITSTSINGTPSHGGFAMLQKIYLDKDKEYWLSHSTRNGNNGRIRLRKINSSKDIVIANIFTNSTNGSLRVGETGYYYLTIENNGNTTDSIEISNLQLEEGSSATTYEPFKHQTLYSNRVIGYEENCYYAFGGGAKVPNDGINSMLADVEGLSIAYATGGSSNYTFWDKDNVFISGKQYLDTSLSSFDKNGFIQVPSNAKYMRFAAGGETNAQPLYKVATVTGELPLRSLPNGVCDTLNLVTGEYVQRVGEVVLDGSETVWKSYRTMNDNNVYNYVTDCIDSNIVRSTKNIVADKIKLRNSATSGIGIYVSSGAICLEIAVENIATINDFRTFLSQNPITVQYELATPIVRKIGLTAKGNYKEASLGDCEWVASPTQIKHPFTTRYRTTSTKSLPIVYNTHLFTDDFNVRHFNIEAHGDYEYVSNMEYGQYVNVRRERLESDTLEAFNKWLAQNPIKVGYITWKQTSSSYSNIQKPIFFNNVNVQFMNNNIDIQPTLTLQARTLNSYVMDMMKANTRYTLKALKNSNSFTIDGTSYGATTNGVFTSPTTLTNKLMITRQDVQELMIIEGDVTGLTIPYYKGIRSAYDDVDRVEMLSQTRNLFNYKLHKSMEFDGINFVMLDALWEKNNVEYKLKPNTKYTLRLKTNNRASWIHIGIDGANESTNIGGFANGWTKTFITNSTGKITIGIHANTNDNIGHTLSEIQLEEGTVATPYQQHQHNTTSLPMPTRLETVEVVRPIMEIGRIASEDGQNVDATNAKRSKDYIPVEPDMILMFMNGSSARAENVYLYGINKNYISAVYTNGTGDLIIPEDCYFIRIHSGINNTSDITVIKQQYKPIALNSLPNGVKDELIINRATSSAKLIQRVGKAVLDGSEDWKGLTEHNNNFRAALQISNMKYEDGGGNSSTIYAINDKLPTMKWHGSWNTTCDAISCNTKNIHIHLANKHYATINLFKEYLKQNPITVYYELAEPVVTEISLKGYPYVYKDGSVQLNTEIPHATKVKYNVNQEHLINGQNETIIRHDKQIDNLYDYIELYLEEEYRMELFRMQLELSL